MEKEIRFKVKPYYTDYSKTYYEKGSFYNLKECKPTLVVLKPTLKCNANCKHCNPRSKKFSTDNIINLKKYEELIKRLKKMGTKQICISGGEPLIYKDLIKLVKIICKYGLVATINTNGWLLNENKFNELMEAGIMGINLSIDSPCASQHDNLRNLRGLFEKATNQISMCKKVNKDFKLNIRMVLSRYNYTDICEMIDLACLLKSDMLSIDMIEADSINNNFLLNNDQINCFKQVYVPKIIKKIKELKINDELKVFNIKQVNDMFNLKFNEITNYSKGIYWPDDTIKKKCDIPSSFMIIEGDGNVLPCNAVEYNRNEIIGNIFDDDIEKLWYSKKWEDFRKNKINYCRECPMNMSYTLMFNTDEIIKKIKICM